MLGGAHIIPAMEQPEVLPLPNMIRPNRSRNGGGIAAASKRVEHDPSTGQFVASRKASLTEQQAAFVRAYVRNGGNVGEAGKLAGYSTSGAHATFRSPAIIEAIRQEQARIVGCEVGSASIAVCLSIMRDPGARNADKVAAARLGMEAARLIRTKEAPTGLGTKALGDMSLDELEAFIAGGNAALAAKTAPKVIEGAPVSAPDDGGSGDLPAEMAGMQSPIDGDGAEMASDPTP